MKFAANVAGALSRRNFLCAGAAGTAALLLRHQPAAGATGQRPNVIVIMTDDQGYADFSCHGNPVLKTPHLDRLHDESVRFTDFHVAPVCTPTRGELMTGMDALRNGACTVPAGHNIVRREVPMMPQIFRENGYRAGQFGKWHLGDTWPDRPMDRGFEKCIWLHGHGVQSSIEFDNDCVDTRYLDGLEVRQSKRYNTDLYFEKAIAWMDARRQEPAPFFVYLATTAPHGPLWVLDSDAAPYRGKVSERAADFFGMIKNIDDNLGKLRAWLASAGLSENTLIVLLTDNGGTAGLDVYTAGLRKGKSSSYEGGHRAACFIHWPQGGFTHPRDVPEPTQVQDILPTLASLCGLQVPARAQFDGCSLDALLRNADAEFPDRKMVVQFGGRVRPQKWDGCVIWKTWRLVGENELYDVALNPGEETNIADANPEIMAALRAHYETWWAEVAPLANRYQPLMLGSAQENPVQLSSNTWEGEDADNPRRVAEGAGGPKGGPWNVEVMEAGTYRIELRRWPFHLACPLDAQVPDKTVSGRAIGLGANKAFPIAGAVLEYGSQRAEMAVSAGDLGAEFEVELDKGRSKLWGWFRDKNGKDLCGAYYAQVTRV